MMVIHGGGMAAGVVEIIMVIEEFIMKVVMEEAIEVMEEAIEEFTMEVEDFIKTYLGS
jgi:hypothetical protein